MRPHKKPLFKKHDAFDQADSESTRVRICQEIRALVDSIEEPDAQDLHILGLCYYDIAIEAKDIGYPHSLFLRALEQDRNYFIARLYSAHCYHDVEDYERALAEYQAVDADKLRAEYALWRYVKLQEQIGFLLIPSGAEG